MQACRSTTAAPAKRTGEPVVTPAGVEAHRGPRVSRADHDNAAANPTCKFPCGGTSKVSQP